MNKTDMLLVVGFIILVIVLIGCMEQIGSPISPTQLTSMQREVPDIR